MRLCPATGLALLAAMSTGACATVPQAAMPDADRAALCDLFAAVRPTGNDLGSGGGLEGEDLSPELDRVPMVALPRRLTCPERSFVLHYRSRDLDDHVAGYWIAADRRTIVLDGSYLAAQLLGGGGRCAYRLEADGWHLSACRIHSQV